MTDQLPPLDPAAVVAQAEAMAARGLRVLFDDRVKVSPGVRFKDAELLGVPTIAVAGRGIESDEPTVEVKDRRSGDRVDVALGDVVSLVRPAQSR